MTCFDSNLSYRDIDNVQKNLNSKNIKKIMNVKSKNVINSYIYNDFIKIKEISKNLKFQTVKSDKIT